MCVNSTDLILPPAQSGTIETSMTKKTKAAIGAAAIGSAAIAAALLYANKRKKKDEPKPTVPSGEKPETD